MNLKILPEYLIPWYEQNARTLPWRENTDPYRVWISEIMLQQTRVEAVIHYYNRFLNALPTAKALAAVPEDTLFKLWEGLGYYSRARNLKKAAQIITEKYNGRFPESYKEILSLPGIGAYTAGAISSICFNLPKAAVDGNVLRVISRFTADDTPIDLAQTKTAVAEKLECVYPKGQCGVFTQALMELGATVCTPKTPKCTSCPLKAFCVSFEKGIVQTLPVKSPKKERKTEQKTLFLLQCGEKFALVKRADSGLLAGMWQLPEHNGFLTPQQAVKTAEKLGVHPSGILKRTEKKHIFTHILWEMVCYHITCEAEAGDFVWANEQDILRIYALPTAYKKFLDNLHKQ